MPEDRPEVPAEVKRAVLLEAGHRCAIPACRHPTTEVAHIDDWAKVREHRFENLIALCPNCHTRYDHHEIDRQAMLAYKRNLPVVGSRYNELERRALAQLGALASRGVKDQAILVPGGSKFFFLMAIYDGLIVYHEDGPESTVGTVMVDAQPVRVKAIGLLQLTQKGLDFADRWLSGKDIQSQS